MLRGTLTLARPPSVGHAVGDLALLALEDLAQLGPQEGQPVGDQPAVDLDLLFAGPSAADARGASAAGLPLQVGPHAPQPRRGVLQLGDLDLQLGLPGLGPAGEDVQDQLAAVEHPRLDALLEVADLRRREVVVELVSDNYFSSRRRLEIDTPSSLTDSLAGPDSGSWRSDDLVTDVQVRELMEKYAKSGDVGIAGPPGHLARRKARAGLALVAASG